MTPQKINPMVYPGLPLVAKQRFVQSNDPIEVEMSEITAIISRYFRIPVSDVVSASRKKHIAKTRMISMWYIKKQTPATWAQIGFYFGARDHSTAIYAIETVNDLMHVDKGYKASVEKCGVLIDRYNKSKL